MKKALAVLLSALILISAFSVQSFAVSGLEKIENYEVVTMEPFSLKSIQDYIDYYEGEELEGEDRQYLLTSSFDVTLSNGETIHAPEYETGYSQDGKRKADCYAWVDVYEVLEAAENGSYTVPLYTEVILYSSLNVELDKKEATSEVSFPKKLVKKLTLVEGEIKFYEYKFEDAFDEQQTYILGSDLDKLCFEIVYGDGSKVKKYVEKRIEWPATPEYYLDGQMIYIYPDNETKAKDVSVEFLDFEKNFSAKISDCPFKEVSIEDASFDDEFNEKTVTFKVRYANGKEKTYTRKLKSYTEFALQSGLPGIIIASRVYEIGSIYGVPVLLEVEETLEEKDRFTDIMCKDFEVTVDGMYFSNYRFKGPEVKYSLLDIFIDIITNLFYEIYYIFG